MKYKSGDEGIWRVNKRTFTARIVRTEAVSYGTEYFLDFKELGVKDAKPIYNLNYNEKFLDKCFTKFTKLEKALL